MTLPLPLTRIQAHLAPIGRPTLPGDLAAATRGALGAAMMGALCERGGPRTCVGCDLVDSCRIPTWYDPGRAGRQAVRPFVIHPPRSVQSGSGAPPVLVLDTVWVGTLPGLLLVDAFRAAARRLGRQDTATWELATLVVHGAGEPAVVVDGGRVRAEWPAPGSLQDRIRLPTTVHSATLRLRSRLQLDRAHTRPTLPLLVRALVHRLRAVQRSLDLPAEPRWPDSSDLATLDELRFEEASRASQRQGQQVDLSGWVGSLSVGPEIAPYADLLAIGEVLQVGRHTSEGLGSYTVHWS